jgi:hypothetical protein
MVLKIMVTLASGFVRNGSISTKLLLWRKVKDVKYSQRFPV